MPYHYLPFRCLPLQELAAEEDPAMLPTRRAGLYRLANAERQAYYTLQVGALRELGVLTRICMYAVRARQVAAAVAASQRARMGQLCPARRIRRPDMPLPAHKRPKPLPLFLCTMCCLPPCCSRMLRTCLRQTAWRRHVQGAG